MVPRVGVPERALVGHGGSRDGLSAERSLDDSAGGGRCVYYLNADLILPQVVDSTGPA